MKSLAFLPQRTAAVIIAATLHLSDRHGITVYDAAYLELALRRGVPLATRDQDLAKAAVDSGITVLPAS